MAIPGKPVPMRTETQIIATSEQAAVPLTLAPPKPFFFHQPVRPFLDKHFPSDARYVGLSRRLFLIVVLAVLSLFLALVIGLAVGLTLRARYDLPSPRTPELDTSCSICSPHNLCSRFLTHYPA